MQSIIDSVEQYHPECKWLHFGVCKALEVPATNTINMVISGYTSEVGTVKSLGLDSFFIGSVVETWNIDQVNYQKIYDAKDEYRQPLSNIRLI